MFEELTCTCHGCERELPESALALSYRDDGGERRAYECACGAVTVTVVR
ncbi:MAG: hypothetical protein ABEJ31_12300 [Haloarculaceae archaeon]